MPERTVQHLIVSEAEAGQKLLSYLKRRLGQELPDTLLHRVIRSGEVRVNGKRSLPFNRLATGDDVRVPPLRPAAELSSPTVAPSSPTETAASPTPPNAARTTAKRPDPTDLATLNIVSETPEYLLLNKPAGLPAQPGSKHQDCLSSRLAAAYARAPFTPTPAHRLDKATSGLTLAAKTYAALRNAQEAFRARTIRKDYLAWVEGAWPWAGTVTLHDLLEKQERNGREQVVTGAGKDALCLVQPLQSREGHTLLLVRLLTGRTHQIRVQLASRGHAIAGDVKYGGQATTQGMCLHAWRLALPDGQVFTASPPWKDKFFVEPKILDSIPLTDENTSF